MPPFTKVANTFSVLLSPTNLAMGESASGKWTMVADQGFELKFQGFSYWAFFKYVQEGEATISYCSQTLQGWYRADTVGPKQMGCYRASKKGVNVTAPVVTNAPAISAAPTPVNRDAMRAYVDALNQAQSSWRADLSDPEAEERFLDHAFRASILAADPAHQSHVGSAPAPVTRRSANGQTPEARLGLPDYLNWHNVTGQDFVGPVRDQKHCGDCYAYVTAAIMEASVRVQTGNQQKIYLSPQHIVSCCPYTQKCDGGYIVLGGRFAEERALAEVRCFAEEPEGEAEAPCSWGCDKPEAYWYATDYRYVGGYYGNCSEEAMLAELAKAPIGVSIYVHSDFQAYKSGIYRHVPDNELPAHVRGIAPALPTNHVVLLTGWGTDPVTNTPYWIIRNSWGTSWGERGYARILRGNNEISIEGKAATMRTVLDRHPQPHPDGHPELVPWVIATLAGLVLVCLVLAVTSLCLGVLARRYYKRAQIPIYSPVPSNLGSTN
ncbi:putative Dipeptidyl peptidase 1 [Paratrimastix pyriformis]|uniref:Dipeptidyl peptidase 1 n=1 Tax=Paratrimastix pyriformis TaxID=342808 RepID=A0ABQ8UV17_9EUKA|nr:putative Dipeptidyl peptidase 1 [Paratrimastix pyriformis]